MEDITLKTENIEGFEVLYQSGYDEFYRIEDMADEFSFELTRHRIDGSSYKIGEYRYSGPELWATPKDPIDEYTKNQVEALRKFFKGESYAYRLHCAVKKNGITLVEKYGCGAMVYDIGDEHLLLESYYFEDLIDESLEEAKEILKSLCA